MELKESWHVLRSRLCCWPIGPRPSRHQWSQTLDQAQMARKTHRHITENLPAAKASCNGLAPLAGTAQKHGAPQNPDLGTFFCLCHAVPAGGCGPVAGLVQPFRPLSH